jgi:hypothetical protein
LSRRVAWWSSGRTLTREGMDPAVVAAIREEMERAEARRLQPRYIRSFFTEAFRRLGGELRAREPSRFEITRTPAVVREHDRLVGRSIRPGACAEPGAGCRNMPLGATNAAATSCGSDAVIWRSRSSSVRRRFRRSTSVVAMPRAFSAFSR